MNSTINSIQEIAILNLTKNGFHLVCPANEDHESTSMKVLSDHYSNSKCREFIKRVNEKPETGCFHPSLKLTIYPIFNPEKSNESELLDAIITDIKAAELNYFRAKKICFVIEESANFNNNLIKEKVRELEGIAFVEVIEIPKS